MALSFNKLIERCYLQAWSFYKTNFFFASAECRTRDWSHDPFEMKMVDNVMRWSSPESTSWFRSRPIETPALLKRNIFLNASHDED